MQEQVRQNHSCPHMGRTWTPVCCAIACLSAVIMLERPALSKRNQRRTPGASAARFDARSILSTPTGGLKVATWNR